MSTIYKFVTVLGILSLLTLSSSVVAKNNKNDTKSSPDIAGSYKCKYHDPSLSNPDATETITFEKNGDTYKVKQIVTDSVIPYAVGIGLFNKDVKNAFTYIYWQPKSPNTTNVEFFVVKSDGSLEGSFAQSNKTKVGTESCTKSSS